MMMRPTTTAGMAKGNGVDLRNAALRCKEE
jgi:hypothetical protein